MGDGAMVDFAYRAQVQKLLDRGHSLSLDTMVGVHEEFLMHLCKHYLFDIARDTMFGKSLFQSLCADLPPPSSSYVQHNSWDSGTSSAWGSRQYTDRAPPEDGCYICKVDHFAANYPDHKGRPRVRWNHGTSQGGCRTSSLARPVGRQTLHMPKGHSPHVCESVRLTDKQLHSWDSINPFSNCVL